MKQLFFFVYIFLIVVTGYTQTQTYRHRNPDRSVHMLYLGDGGNEAFRECNDTLLNRSIPYCWSTIQPQNKNENYFHFDFSLRKPYN